jgi:hypothetical protein
VRGGRHPGLAFVVGTLVAGQLRDQRLGRADRERREAAEATGSAAEAGGEGGASAGVGVGSAITVRAAVESGAATVSLPEPRQGEDNEDRSAEQPELEAFTEVRLTAEAGAATTPADPAASADPAAPIDPAEPGELTAVAQ